MTEKLPILWKPNPIQVENSLLNKFRKLANAKFNLNLKTYEDIHSFSINDLRFYQLLWDFCQLRHSKSYSSLISNPKALPSELPQFYPGSLFSFSENVLHPIHLLNSTSCNRSNPHNWPSNHSVAIYEIPEGGGLDGCKEGFETKEVTWGQLRDRVSIMAKAMREKGIKKMDTVAHVACNTARPIVTFLAANSIGAVFSALPTDAGIDALSGRLRTIRPKLLFVDDSAYYNGKVINVLSRVSKVIDRFSSENQALSQDFEVVIHHNPLIKRTFQWESQNSKIKVSIFETWLTSVGLEEEEGMTMKEIPRLKFEQLSLSHPLMIVFSSGTTSEPKSIVHSQSVTINQRKEALLQFDVKPYDVWAQITSTGWIMWMYLLGVLNVGGSILCLEGSPLSPNPTHLPKLLSKFKVTGFGCSPRYLSELEKNNFDSKNLGLDFSNLRLVTSTGSPLSLRNSQWFYQSFAQIVKNSDGNFTQLMSMSGGTDIASTFVAGSIMSPVYGNLISCKTLGMSIQILDPLNGSNIESTGEPGELICSKPFPTQPLFFWGKDTKSLKSKYHESYYARFDELEGEDEVGKGLWAQGDFIRREFQNENGNGGALEIMGRSDGVLNRSGIRFGSSDIYQVVERFDWISDSICVGQKREGLDDDERILLFLKLAPNQTLTKERIHSLNQAIKIAHSSRHLPDHIFSITDIPLTANGKKTELAVKSIVSGNTKFKPSSAIANPLAIEEFRKFADLESILGKEKSRL